MGLNDTYTFLLFKEKPSFLNGVASILDISPSIERYNQSESGKEADKRAIIGDWLAIGEDMKNAIKNYESEKQTAA